MFQPIYSCIFLKHVHKANLLNYVFLIIILSITFNSCTHSNTNTANNVNNQVINSKNNTANYKSVVIILFDDTLCKGHEDRDLYFERLDQIYQKLTNDNNKKPILFIGCLIKKNPLSIPKLFECVIKNEGLSDQHKAFKLQLQKSKQKLIETNNRLSDGPKNKNVAENSGTEILTTLSIASDIFNKYNADKYLYILSDMFEQSDICDLSQEPVSIKRKYYPINIYDNDTKKVDKGVNIPKHYIDGLKDSKIYICGAYSISTEDYECVKAWWVELLEKKANGHIIAYGKDFDIDLY